MIIFFVITKGRLRRVWQGCFYIYTMYVTFYFIFSEKMTSLLLFCLRRVSK